MVYGDCVGRHSVTLWLGLPQAMFVLACHVTADWMGLPLWLSPARQAASGQFAHQTRQPRPRSHFGPQ